MRGLRVFLFVVMVLLAVKTVQAGQLCVDEDADCFAPWEDDTRNGAFLRVILDGLNMKSLITIRIRRPQMLLQLFQMMVGNMKIV